MAGRSSRRAPTDARHQSSTRGPRATRLPGQGAAARRRATRAAVAATPVRRTSPACMFDIGRVQRRGPGITRLVSFGTYFNAFPAATGGAGPSLDERQAAPAARGEPARSPSAARRRTGMSCPSRDIIVTGGPEINTMIARPAVRAVHRRWLVLVRLARIRAATTGDRGRRVARRRPTASRPAGSASASRRTTDRSSASSRSAISATRPDVLAILDRCTSSTRAPSACRSTPTSPRPPIGLGRPAAGDRAGQPRRVRRASPERCTRRSGPATSEYLLLLDDDVITEPEGIIRAVTFADLAREPTIVGGHMFDVRTVGAACVRRDDREVPLVLGCRAEHVARPRLRRALVATTPWLHRPVDVDYNGWWMCLIPVEMIHKIGYSVPMFIKWDDAEYGCAPARAGYRTVSLPGQPCGTCRGTIRTTGSTGRRTTTPATGLSRALLHSAHPRGGTLLRESAIQR